VHGILLAQLAFLWEAVAAYQHARVLQQWEAEITGYTHVILGSFQMPEYSPVYPVPGALLAQLALCREIVVFPQHARMLQRRVEDQLKIVYGHTIVIQDTYHLPEHLPVYLHPGLALVQHVFLSQCLVVLPQIVLARLLQCQEEQEAVKLKEVIGITPVMLTSRDPPQQVPVYPVPGAFLVVQHAILPQGLVVFPQVALARILLKCQEIPIQLQEVLGITCVMILDLILLRHFKPV